MVGRQSEPLQSPTIWLAWDGRSEGRSVQVRPDERTALTSYATEPAPFGTYHAGSCPISRDDDAAAAITLSVRQFICRDSAHIGTSATGI